jgi:hypothetical protein
MTTSTTRAAAARAWVVAVMVGAVVLGAVSQPPHQLAACKNSHRSIFLLEAQAVPSATFIPCALPLPPGWSYGGSDIRSGLARFWLDSDRAGSHAAEVTLVQSCDVSRASPTPLQAAPPGLRRFDEPATRQSHSSTAYFVFRGGCVTYRFSFTQHGAPALFREADRALGFTPRSVYVKGVREDAGLPLCGAEAPPCPG